MVPGGEKLEELSEGAGEEGGEEREVVGDDGGFESADGSISGGDHLVHLRLERQRKKRFKEPKL